MVVPVMVASKIVDCGGREELREVLVCYLPLQRRCCCLPRVGEEGWCWLAASRRERARCWLTRERREREGGAVML